MPQVQIGGNFLKNGWRILPSPVDTLAKKAYAFRRYSPVAQLAEQVAVNHWVRGSNPRGGEDLPLGRVYSREMFCCQANGVIERVVFRNDSHAVSSIGHFKCALRGA